MRHENLTEQEIIRRASLQQLRDLGIDPYPAEEVKVSAFAKSLLEGYNSEAEQPIVTIAGRIMTRRIMGNASFIELQDATGRIQVYLKRDDLCPGEDKILYNTVFKKLMDLGDYVAISGYMFTTNTGEVSLHASTLKLLAKALKPLPVVKRDDEGNVYDGFTDPELRYRMRYVDLTVNPELKEIFLKRSLVISSMRTFFVQKGWIETETPILQPVHGGAAARPFTTHHNTLDMPLYLRIANELYLKRLIVAGFDGVFEFGKMFRNEGMDRTHNPEFTSMELYVAYKDYIWMMDMVEACLEHVALAATGNTVVTNGQHEISFKGPYTRLTMFESIAKYTGTDVSNFSEAELVDFCKREGIETSADMGKGKLIDEIFSARVEANLIQPTFITDYPIEMTPLAKKHRTAEGLVERFELFINGKEIANAYTELNDPIDQRERFEEQLKLAARGDDEAMAMDDDFIRALEYGMPPTSGLGIGIDRLVMLLTNQSTIQEVLFFPQMRPEAKHVVSSDEEFAAAGVAVAWVPILRKMGINTVQQLREANPNKLFNDLGGQRKKLKIEEPLPAKEQVEAWCRA